MAIEIKRLTPALAQDYLRFFDETPHSTNRPEHKCYCVCWAGGDYTKDDFSTAEKRREAAARSVFQGRLQGYLAYSDGVVVGWVNANAKADCASSLSWNMFMRDVGAHALNALDGVKSVCCFAIAPNFRRRGVAGALLDRVIYDAFEEGFECVEAYPNRAFVNTEDDFMGPVSLYENRGFCAVYEAGNKLVMRKSFGGAGRRLTLVEPSPEFEAQVMEYKALMLSRGDSFDGCAGLKETDSYADWLDFKTRNIKKYGAGYVPSRVYLAVRKRDNALVGILDYRLELSEYLSKYGGNIGYSVKPGERGKRYAKEMLALAVKRARARGADKLLITCLKHNLASAKTIISNGGALENEVIREPGGEIVQRYWIIL